MWSTIGHGWATEFLRGAINGQQVAHAYLFTGSANVGKTHLALEFASALNCTGDAPPCRSCSACRRTAEGTHPDVTLVEPDGDRIKIDQVRGLQRQLALSPHEGPWRVCIIAEFQAATVEAANAFLKTLEEPPSRVVIVLTATDASLLLPTIVSRCQILPLRAVPMERIECVLVEQWKESEDRARLIARLSGGRVGWAIRATQEPSMLAHRHRCIDELLSLVQRGTAARIGAAERLSKGGDLAEVIRVWQTWWRDVVLAKSGCEELVVNLDFSDALNRLAGQCDLAEAEAYVRDTESALQRLDQNVNARLTLEVLLLAWRQVRLS